MECENMSPSKYPLFFFFFCTLLIGVLLAGPADEREAAGGRTETVEYSFLVKHEGVITYDTAFVYVTNGLDETVNISIQTAECYQCKLIVLGPVGVRKVAEVKVDTTWPITMDVSVGEDINNASVCGLTQHFKQNGNYSWYINKETSGSNYDCKLVTTNNPADAFIPIYVAIGILAGVALIYIMFKQMYNSGSGHRFLNYLGMERVVSSDLGTPSNPVSEADSNSIQRPSTGKPRRLKSLDAFRGFSLVIMIFVNYGSGQYHGIFGHSTWNGLTVADLVFPWFIWIMGVSITMSFHSLIRHGVKCKTIFMKILRRFVILFGLGIMLDGGIDFTMFRVPGVLQRIAFSYLVVASVHLISATHKEEEYRIRHVVYRELRDILDYWFEWIIMLSLLALHICLTFFLPVPGCPTGYLGPGGPLLGTNGSLTDCTGGAANYIDKLILTYDHCYQRGTAKKIYQTVVAHDPEGILGSLTSIFMTFLGLQAGKIFHLFSYARDRILRFFIWCLLTGLIAGALCGFSKEDGLIPVNKNLWSVSFILATASMAFFLLSVFYYLIDVKCWWTGVPVYFIGMNSITVYCGSEVLHPYFPFQWKPVLNTHAELLAMNLIGASLWVLISYYMYTLNFFVKI